MAHSRFPSPIEILYGLTRGLQGPNSRLLDRLFAEKPDYYGMRRNGSRRFDAISTAILNHLGPCDSILDVSVYEGYGAKVVAERTGAQRITGLDISDTALQRAKISLEGLKHDLAAFDLSVLFKNPDATLPVNPCDVVLVSEVLYMIGPFAHHLWRYPILTARKRSFLQSLLRYARKGMIVQHFGVREKMAIGAIVESCGGYLVDDEWGIYVVPAPQ